MEGATPLPGWEGLPLLLPVVYSAMRLVLPFTSFLLRALHSSPVPLASKRARPSDANRAESSSSASADAASPAELSSTLKRTIEHAKRELTKLRGGSATPRECAA